MAHPKNDITNVGFPESQLIWRTTLERCAELSAAWHNGTLHKMTVENLCKVSGYKGN